jgi:transposase
VSSTISLGTKSLDDQWDRIKDLLPGREGHVGGTAKDNRLFVEAVLYRFRTGCPWRDLPERFGDWKMVDQRFSALLRIRLERRIGAAQPDVLGIKYTPVRQCQRHPQRRFGLFDLGHLILNPGVGAVPWGGYQPERVSFMPAAGAGEAAVGGLAGTLLGRD